MARAAMWLHRLLLAAAWRVLPPELEVFDLALGSAKTRALAAAISLGVFEALEGPGRTSHELADVLGLDRAACHRFLRALGMTGMVRTTASGRFQNTRASRALLAGRGLASFATYFAGSANTRAWEAMEHALRTGAPAFPHVHGRSIWEHLDANPDELDTFAEAMAYLTSMDAPTLAAGYPFAEVSDVCDVGGGSGILVAELLARHAHLTATVLDREQVLPHADRRLRQRGVRDRAHLVGGDFFGEVPPGASLYLLKNVLHDWDDLRAQQILTTIRRSCGPDSRLLVIEECQEDLEIGPTAIADLQMLMACDGGRERSERELAALLADSGFEHRRTWPTPVRVQLLEARPA